VKAGNKTAEPRVYELWLTKYVKDAYEDQTGAKHWGNIVWGRILVTEIARFAGYEGYGQKWYPDVNIAAEDDDGRIFHGIANLIDYWGGMSWRMVYGESEGEPEGYFWHSAPHKPTGYVYKDGHGPVEKLLAPKPRPLREAEKSTHPPRPPRPLKA
jgi:hypothetical protein